MTRAEIDRIADLLAAAGRRNVPVPISIWKEMEMLKIPATELTIDSDFAILDVKKGRKKLAKKMPQGAGMLAGDERIPITIHGYITHQTGSDDGVSIEFGVDVEKVVIERDLRSVLSKEAKVVATRIGKATVKDGKVKPLVKQSVSRKIAAKKKADRTVKALKANAAKSKATAKKAG